MKTKFLLILILAFGLGINATNAQIRHKEITQHQRIKQGVKSGQLTKSEAMNLRKGQRDVHQDIKAAKADGKVTRAERKDIKRDERQNSRKIYRKKHNERERK